MMYFSVRKLHVQTAEGKTLLRPTSLEIERGKVIGVYGPNGSGKTTFLRSIAGVNSHFQIGEVWVDGMQITHAQNPSSRVHRIMYLGSDYPSPFDIRVRELMEMGSGFSGKPQSVEHITAELGLKALNSRLVGTLSDGEKQWAMFGRALIQSPQVMVLDESFSKLDLDKLLHAAKVIQKQAAAGMTFVVASHDLNFLSEISDQLVLMQNGKILQAGEVRETLNSFYLEKLYPALQLQVIKSPNSGKEKIIY